MGRPSQEFVAIAFACLIVGSRASAQEGTGALAEDPASVAVTPGLTAGTRAGVEAQAPDVANPYAGDLLTRYRLSGDWWGARSGLADRGLTFDFFATQFYQGIASGGREQAFRYGGKLDFLFNLDAGKLDLLQGFFLNLHAETRFGEDVNNIDGLIAPSNLPMNFPEADRNVTSITGLKFTQALSEDFAVYLGKINTLDEYGSGTPRPSGPTGPGSPDS